MSPKFEPRLRARAISKSSAFQVKLRKICTTLWRENDLEAKIVENWHAQSTFLKFSAAKFAPGLRARAIWKSKLLKTDCLGTFLEVQSLFRVTGAGISRHCKIRGRRRSSWGLQKRWQAWWIWRRPEMMLFAWQAQGFRVLWNRCLKSRTLNPWKGCKFHTLQESFRVARMPRLNFFVAGNVLLKHPPKNR